MKKSIIFFVIIFLVKSTYSQEECVEFDKAWVASYGVRTSVGVSAIDSENNLIVTGGYTGSSASVGGIALPTPPSPWEGTFIAKMDTLGNAIWATYAIGQGAGRMLFHSADLDNLGNIYLAGRFNGTVNFQGNILSSNSIASSQYFDGFFAKLDTAWQLQWIEVFPGCLHFDMVTDQNKNSFYLISQVYLGVPAIINQDTFYAEKATDILVTKIDAQGQVQFVRQAKGKLVQLFSLSIDNNDNVYLSGGFEDTLYFDNHTLVSAFHNGRTDMFIAKMSPQGTFEWATQSERLTNAGRVSSAYHSLTPQGNIYVYGRYEGSIDFGGNILNVSNTYTNYLTVLNTQGQILNAEEILSSDSIRHINGGVTDQNGSLYLTGEFKGSCAFGNTILSPVNQNGSSYVCKLNYEGGNSTFEWAKQPLGSGKIGLHISMCTDINELYISGIYNDGDAVFGEHTLPAPATGYTHGFITKISECESSNINTPNPLSQISIFPNPANTQITITNLPANSTINISDITGRVFYSQKTKNNTLQIPTTEWSNGMYFVQIINGENRVNKKVVIQ